MNASAFGSKGEAAVRNLCGSKQTAFTLIELLAGEPKAAAEVSLRRWTRRGQRGALSLPETAFTLIELLVVIATIALLAMTLLPALAGTQAQPKVTACEARFRQWAATANLYANDNRGWLPSFNPGQGGAWAWDVGTNMLDALYPYGMDVPDWFCPMRPTQWDAANAWSYYISPPALVHPIQNIGELRLYFSRVYPGECEINDNYWVPRQNSLNPSPTTPWFPPDYSSKLLFPPTWIKAGNPTCRTYGWPQRLHDIAAPYVPFVSDTAASGRGIGLNSPHPASPAVTNIAPSTAHVANSTLLGVNLAFADGHVASHTADQMRPVYYDGANYWFY